MKTKYLFMSFFRANQHGTLQNGEHQHTGHGSTSRDSICQTPIPEHTQCYRDT